MVLSNKLVDEFVSATFDGEKTKTNNSYYGTAVINGEGSFVRLDGSDIDTPAIFTVKAHDGDRVLVILQNRKVIVTGNITSPSIILGVLEANDYILVRGYLTTNENRTSYNDDRATGLTFSSEGIGAKGNTSKWYMTADGHLYANDVDITGKVTAGSGKIGDFTIGSMLYYGSKNSFDSSAAGIFFGKDGIALGENSPFKVTAAGALTATTATIAGDITATSGYLGSKTNGFTIDEWGIFSGAKGESSNGYITLTTKDFSRTINNEALSGLRFAIGSKFAVDASGKLHAADGIFSGTIKSSSGNIGDFTIGNGLYTNSKSSMSHANAGVYIGSDGIALGNPGTFSVTSEGKLSATGASISGAITATSLTLGQGVKIDYEDISDAPDLTVYVKKNGTIGTLPSDGATSSDTTGFRVSTTGALIASNAIIYGTVYASSGKFTGDIYANSLRLGDNVQIGYDKISGRPDLTVYIEKDGTLGVLPAGEEDSANKTGFKVSSQGLLTASNAVIYGTVYAKAGKFTGDIVANSLTLGSGATVSGLNYSSISGTPNLDDVVRDGDITDVVRDADLDAYATKNSLTVYIQKDGGLGTRPSDMEDPEGSSYFKVSTNGLLQASNAVIYGTVYAKAGKFTGDIVAKSLTLGDNVFVDYSKIENGPYLDDVVRDDDITDVVRDSDISDVVRDTDLSNTLAVYIKEDKTLGTLPPSSTTTATTAYTGFLVSKTGLLTAANAVIFGKIYASEGEFTGKIIAGSGEIGGFAIDTTSIHTKNIAVTSNVLNSVAFASSNFSRDILDSDGTYTTRNGLRLAIADKFAVDNSGILYASSVKIAGNITANGGAIGGFAIDTTSIHTNGVAVTSNAVSSVALTSVNFTRSIDGTERNGLRLAIADKFAVDNSGNLFASSVNIKGAITATSLSLGDGVKIGYGSISNTPDLSVYISKNGQIGTFPSGMPTPTGTTGFKVSTSGLLQAANAVIYGTIYASAGEIGGFAIDSTSIHTSGVAITSTDTSSIGFASSDFSRSIGGRSLDVLRLAIADSFGVTKKGTLFAKQANFAKSVTLYDEDFSSYSDYETVSLEFARQNAILPPHRSTDPTPSGSTIYGLKSSSSLIAKGIYSSTVIRASGAISTLSSISAGGSIESLSDISADGNINARGTVISVGSTGTVTEPDTTYRRVRIFNASGEGSFRISATGAMGIYSETQSEWLIYTKPETVGKWAYIPMTLSVTSSVISNGVFRSNDTSGSTVKGFYCQNSAGYYGMQVDASGNFVIYDQKNSKAIMTFYPSTAKLWDDGYIEINRVLMVAGPNGDSIGPRMVASCLYTNGQRINYFATGGNSSTASHQTWLNVNGQFNGSTTYDTISYASASSDIRLKTNITNTEVSDALNLIKKIKIRSFDWKDMGHEGQILDHQKIGFIADELEELDSKLAAGGGYDEDGGMIIKSVDTFYLLGYVVKALQELDNRITVLQKGA